MNKSKSNRLKWLEEKISALDLKGRDEFYSHLLTQEIPFWINDLKRGNRIRADEINDLINCRGFNKKEALKFKKLVSLLNANLEKIMESYKDEKLSLRDFLKELKKKLSPYMHHTLFEDDWLLIINRMRY